MCLWGLAHLEKRRRDFIDSLKLISIKIINNSLQRCEDEMTLQRFSMLWCWGSRGLDSWKGVWQLAGRPDPGA